MPPDLDAIAYVARERAITAAAAEVEARQTIAALVATAEEHGKPGDAFRFTHEHIRALVRSAFFAGVVHELDRAKAKRDAADPRVQFGGAA